jgi:hypothetical protein
MRPASLHLQRCRVCPMHPKTTIPYPPPVRSVTKAVQRQPRRERMRWWSEPSSSEKAVQRQLRITD